MQQLRLQLRHHMYSNIPKLQFNFCNNLGRLQLNKQSFALFTCAFSSGLSSLMYRASANFCLTVLGNLLSIISKSSMAISIFFFCLYLYIADFLSVLPCSYFLGPNRTFVSPIYFVAPFGLYAYTQSDWCSIGTGSLVLKKLPIFVPQYQATICLSGDENW